MVEDSTPLAEYGTVLSFHEAELVTLGEKVRDLEREIAELRMANRELWQYIRDTLAYIELFKATVPGMGMPLNTEQAKQYRGVFERLYTQYGR